MYLPIWLWRAYPIVICAAAFAIVGPLGVASDTCRSSTGLPCDFISRAGGTVVLMVLGIPTLRFFAQLLVKNVPWMASRGGTYVYLTNAKVWSFDRKNVDSLRVIGAFNLEDTLTRLLITDCDIWYRDQYDPVTKERLQRGAWFSTFVYKEELDFSMIYQTKKLIKPLPNETEPYYAMHKMTRSSRRTSNRKSRIKEVWIGDVEGKGIEGKIVCVMVARKTIHLENAVKLIENDLAELEAFLNKQMGQPGTSLTNHGL